MQRDVFCVFSGDGVSRLRDYLNFEAEKARTARPGEVDDDEISIEDDNENGGVVVTVGGHPTAGMPVVVVGAGGQIVQTMYQHGVDGEEDEDGIDGDDEQEGDISGADVTAMTGSMQMTGLADQMPLDGPAVLRPSSQHYDSSSSNHDMTQ